MHIVETFTVTLLHFCILLLLQSHGVIYVVDSSTNQRMAECKDELHKVLQDSRIKTKPFLM